ncbi:MAG: hypothetical protein JRH11_06595, partial [Deltaproteobacteria bacterium]|nr:hypothetical protein [Deltaproteobacteria bacterium]
MPTIKHLALAALVLTACAAPASGDREVPGAWVAIVSPAGEELVGGVVSVVIDVATNQDAERVELWADDEHSIATWGEGGGGLVVDLDTALLDDGLHTLRVVVTWPDGQESADERVIIVDNGGPVVTIDEALSRVFHEDGEFGFAVTVTDSTRVTALRLRVDGLTVE